MLKEVTELHFPKSFFLEVILLFGVYGFYISRSDRPHRSFIVLEKWYRLKISYKSARKRLCCSYKIEYTIVQVANFCSILFEL